MKRKKNQLLKQFLTVFWSLIFTAFDAAYNVPMLIVSHKLQYKYRHSCTKYIILCDPKLHYTLTAREKRCCAVNVKNAIAAASRLAGALDPPF